MNNASDHSATLLEFLKGMLPLRLRLILPLAAAAVALAALFIYPAYAQDGDEPLTDRPYDLHATAGDEAVTLTWKDPEVYPSHTRVVVLRHRPELGETEPQVHGSYVVAEHVDGGRRYVDGEVEAGVMYVYAVQTVKDFFGFLTEASDPVEVRMPAAGDDALTARFLADTGPSNHGGDGQEFTIRIEFNEDIDTGYRVLRDDALEVEGGEALKFKRVEGSSSLWEITVEPGSDAGVTLTMPETTDCTAEDAVCTADDKPLSESVTVTIPGPASEPTPTATPEPTPTATPTPTPTTATPDEPTGLAASVVSGVGVNLSWDGPADESVTGYEVLRRDLAVHGPGEFETIESDTGSAETAYTDATVEAGGSYVYRVRAINAHGASVRSGYARADVPGDYEPPEPELSGTGTFVPGQDPVALPQTASFNLASGNGSASGIWADTTTIWVANDSSGSGNMIFAYNRSDGMRNTDKEITTLTANVVVDGGGVSMEGNHQPRGIWSDGDTMFVVDREDSFVYAYHMGDDPNTTETEALGDADTGKHFALASSNQKAEAIWGNTNTIWVADDDFGGSNRIFAYTRSDGSEDTSAEFSNTVLEAIPPHNYHPHGLTSDGTTMYVVDTEDRNVYAYTISNQNYDPEKSFALDAGNTNAEGITHDGSILWVVDSGDDRVYRYSLTGNPPPIFLLVSNRNETLTSTSFSQSVHNSEFRGQQFTTGSREGGYHLVRVTFDLISAGGDEQPLLSLRESKSNNLPGDKIVDLTAPNPLPVGTGSDEIAEWTFTAPDNTLLAPDTKYFIVAEGGNANRFRIRTTASDNQRSETGTVWSMGDILVFQGTGSTATFSASPTGNALVMSIGGRDAPDPLGAPQNVTVTPGNGELTLNWDEVPDAEGYVVQWKSGMEDYEEARQITSTSTNAVVTGLNNGTEYTLRVKATKPGVFDTWSADVTGTPEAPVSLGAPQNVTVTPGHQQLILTWDAVSDAEGYVVQWKSGTEEYDERRQILISTTTSSIVVAGLANGTEYTLRVKATKPGVTGTWSADVTGTPEAASTTTPGAPTGLTATAGNAQVTLAWTAGSQGDSPITKHQYRQRRSQDGNFGAWMDIPDSAPSGDNATSYTVTGLTNDTEYIFQVRAVNVNGGGAVSLTRTATPKTPSIGWSITADRDEIAEGENVTVTIRAPGGSTFETDQTLTLAFGGTLATHPVTRSDYLVSHKGSGIEPVMRRITDEDGTAITGPVPHHDLTLAAGETQIVVTIEAVFDFVAEPQENLDFKVFHHGHFGDGVTYTRMGENGSHTITATPDGSIETVFILVERSDRSPVVVSAEIDGNRVTLQFNRVLSHNRPDDIGSVESTPVLPSELHFGLQTGGVEPTYDAEEGYGGETYADTFSLSGSVVILTFAEAVECGTEVWVTYEQGGIWAPLDDGSGSDYASPVQNFAVQATNNTSCA